MKNKLYQIIPAKNVTGHRPFTALLYMGWSEIPEAVYRDAYIEYHKRNYKISVMYAGVSSYLIIIGWEV